MLGKLLRNIVSAVIMVSSSYPISGEAQWLISISRKNSERPRTIYFLNEVENQVNQMYADNLLRL